MRAPRCSPEGFLRFAESVPRCQLHGLPMRPAADSRPGRSGWKCIHVRTRGWKVDNGKPETTARKAKHSRRVAGWYDEPGRLPPLEVATV